MSNSIEYLYWKMSFISHPFWKMREVIVLHLLSPPHPHVMNWICSKSQGAFLVTDNRVFNGPLGRLLCSFARTAHSADSLHSAPLCSLAHSLSCFARLLHLRARSLTLITPSWDIEIHECVFTLWTRFRGRNAFLVVSRNTPLRDSFWRLRTEV